MERLPHSHVMSLDLRERFCAIAEGGTIRLFRVASREAVKQFELDRNEREAAWHLLLNPDETLVAAEVSGAADIDNPRVSVTKILYGGTTGSGGLRPFQFRRDDDDDNDESFIAYLLFWADGGLYVGLQGAIAFCSPATGLCEERVTVDPNWMLPGGTLIDDDTALVEVLEMRRPRRSWVGRFDRVSNRLVEVWRPPEGLKVKHLHWLRGTYPELGD